MTDAAIVADSAPVSDAPAGGAPINEAPAGFVAPLGSQVPPEAQAKQDTPPKSIDDSIDRAIAKSAAVSKEPKADAKTDAKAETKEPAAKVEAKEPPARGEGGKFAAKEPAKVDDAAPAPKPAEVKPSHTASEPPARFSADAKNEWATAPESVRAEVSRMERELTQGFQKHREAAERDAGLNEFHEMAKHSGKELRGVVAEYVNMENLLRKDLVGGLDTICQRMGVSLKDVAAHVMNQPADKQSSQQDATIRELKAELEGLKQQVGGVTQTFQQQREQSTLAEINSFAAQPEHSRFEELADDIAFFMKTGRAKDLPEAYALAERLNPAAAPAKDEAPAASSAAPAPAAHTDKGQKSVSGAPTSGLTRPSGKRAIPSLDESLDRAFGRAG